MSLEVSVAGGIIAFILAIIAVILLYVLVLPKKKDGTFGSKFMQWVYDFCHFRKLYIESFLRFVYVFFTVYFVIYGIVSIFTTSFLAGLSSF